jgi:hypothetical protein
MNIIIVFILIIGDRVIDKENDYRGDVEKERFF